jgi:hypothetical protein
MHCTKVLFPFCFLVSHTALVALCCQSIFVVYIGVDPIKQCLRLLLIIIIICASPVWSNGGAHFATHLKNQLLNIKTAFLTETEHHGGFESKM